MRTLFMRSLVLLAGSSYLFGPSALANNELDGATNPRPMVHPMPHPAPMPHPFPMPHPTPNPMPTPHPMPFPMPTPTRCRLRIPCRTRLRTRCRLRIPCRSRCRRLTRCRIRCRHPIRCLPRIRCDPVPHPMPPKPLPHPPKPKPGTHIGVHPGQPTHVVQPKKIIPHTHPSHLERPITAAHIRRSQAWRTEYVQKHGAIAGHIGEWGKTWGDHYHGRLHDRWNYFGGWYKQPYTATTAARGSPTASMAVSGTRFGPYSRLKSTSRTRSRTGSTRTPRIPSTTRPTTTRTTTRPNRSRPSSSRACSSRPTLFAICRSGQRHGLRHAGGLPHRGDHYGVDAGRADLAAPLSRSGNVGNDIVINHYENLTDQAIELDGFVRAGRHPGALQGTPGSAIALRDLGADRDGSGADGAAALGSGGPERADHRLRRRSHGRGSGA